MDQALELSFDLKLSSNTGHHENALDHFQRLKQEIRLLESENQELCIELEQIQNNPSKMIEAFQAKLMNRITELRQQNEGIEQLIERSKMPGYAEMTKKKPSYIAQTPNKSFFQEDDSQMDFERKNPFQSVEMSEKIQASTCHNYPIQTCPENPLRPLEPLHDQQLKYRAQLTSELLLVINETTEVTSQFQNLMNQEEISRPPSLHSLAQNSQKLQQISKYRQKLLQLLKKLKARQLSQQQIVREYQTMYDETLKKFKEATLLLNQLTMVNETESLDDIYAEVLQLEERLRYINEQLQRVDETQWLKDIQAELLHALKRLGIPPPEVKSQPGVSANQVLRQRIDALAQILIECVVMHKADQKQKLSMLKMYYEQQKQNNKKIIKNLQNKEQGLSKKLIDLQMNN